MENIRSRHVIPGPFNLSLVGLLDTPQLAAGRKAAFGPSQGTGGGMVGTLRDIKAAWTSLEKVAILYMI
jgi:hypothetical protein